MPYHTSTKKTKSKTTKVPKGFHLMPNGRLMKGSKHPTKKNKKK